MPWSSPALHTGREWVRAPSTEILEARWERLAAANAGQRSALFRPTRARTPHSTVTQLPGQRTPTGRLSREAGPFPAPVRIRHGAFDRLWLLPDHRLLDQARPQLWRVADDAQVFAVVQPHTPEAPGPAVTFCAEIPDGDGRRQNSPVFPAHRLPGGREPNLAPGLTGHLADRLGVPVTGLDVLAWIAAVTAHPAAARNGERVPVPLTASVATWSKGTALGRQVLWLHTFGARCADPEQGRPPRGPRMPGGRRLFVRRSVPARPLPGGLDHDPDGEALLLGDGRIAPVPGAVWEYRAGGVPVLREWFARRSPNQESVEAGSLEAIRMTAWPQTWTTELIELASVLSLLCELRPAQAALTASALSGPLVTTGELRAAGVLPAPAWSGRPASVLSHQEEGPEGQFPLF
ncbi:type ISP restriction/modification enzyme [Wenjunlia tyrosinilytica]